jgi:thiol:disulfide interchange protein DsbC
MQPETPTIKPRPVLGSIVICALVAAGYFLLPPDQPSALGQAALVNLTSKDTFANTVGTGERSMHVFISVDCGYCRKLEPALEQLNNVTVHYHLLPGHSAGARGQAVRVWCSPDPAKAWAAAARGGAVESTPCDSGALDRNYALAKSLGFDHTPTIVFADGRVVVGAVGKEVLEEGLASKTARATR